MWKIIQVQSIYLRSWNPRAKPKLVITFWAILLMMSFEYLILIFYTWVPSTTIEGTMKKQQQHFAPTFGHLTKKNDGFSTPEHSFRILAMYIHQFQKRIYHAWWILLCWWLMYCVCVCVCVYAYIISLYDYSLLYLNLLLGRWTILHIVDNATLWGK